MKKRKMKSERRKFGKVFAFAVLFATLAFIIISVGITSAATIQAAASQPKIELFVDNTTTSVPIIDLLDAIDQNMVAASFIGWKNNSVIINITNYADHGLEIKVPKGLILNSLNGSKSNMAVGEIFGVITTSPLPNGWFILIRYSSTSRIILDTNESKNYFISAYNVEFDKPTLGYKKEFSIGCINYDIQKIIETTDAFHSWDKSTDAIQSAIWCYTDDISKEELVSKRENVRDKEVLDAKAMLDLAGFETTSKKLFTEEIIISTANMRERLEDDKVMIYVNKKRESDKIGYKKAKESYRWIISDVIIKNKMDKPLYFDVHDIKLRNNENRIDVYDYSSYGTNELDYAFKSTSAYPLPSNDTYRGEVAFEVPNNVSNLKMIFDIERFYGEIMLVDSQNPDTVPVSNFTPAYKIGEKAKDEDIVITVNSKRETEIIKNQRAKENRTYLILNITIKNIGTKNLYYYPYHFAVQDENGYLFKYHYTTTYSLENAFESGDLQPGQEYQGEISFEISKSSENLEMWYSPYSGPYLFVGLALPPPVPKTNVFVDKTERLFTSDTYIDHNQTYKFDIEWGAGVWDVKNLDNVTYTITTPIDLTYICTWELYQNGSETGSTLPFNHTGENYTWVLPLKNRFASSIGFYLPEKTVQDNPWADVVADTMNGDNYTWVNVTFIPRSPSISVDLTIRGEIIDFSYPPEFEEELFFPDYSITFYGDWENLNQDKSYNFSILVDNPKEVELWLYETHGRDTEYNNTLTLPVSELGSVTVAYNVPVKWEHGSTQPRYTQGITIEFEEINGF